MIFYFLLMEYCYETINYVFFFYPDENTFWLCYTFSIYIFEVPFAWCLLRWLTLKILTLKTLETFLSVLCENKLHLRWKFSTQEILQRFPIFTKSNSLTVNNKRKDKFLLKDIWKCEVIFTHSLLIIIMKGLIYKYEYSVSLYGYWLPNSSDLYAPFLFGVSSENIQLKFQIIRLKSSS